MSDKDYSPHESWCDTQNNISDTCNCMVSGYIEKIEKLRADLQIAVEAMKWIMPKVHQATHEGEIHDCQKATCVEYRYALAKIEGEK